MDNHLTIELRLNIEDIKEYTFYNIHKHLKAIPALCISAMLRILLGILITASVEVIIFDTILKSPSPSILFDLGIAITLIIGLWPLLLPVYSILVFFIAYLSRKKKMMNHKTTEPLIHINFNKDKIIIKNLDLNTLNHLNWDEVFQIIDFPALIEISFKSTSEKKPLSSERITNLKMLLLIPKRCFKNQADLDNFLNLISQRVDKNKIIKYP
ncbi:MAG: hypothetical protein GX198_05150 [Epulopiscium sp.]|nr:hypothetical protein [Candidatus Epulonipiscium sp.]